MRKIDQQVNEAWCTWRSMSQANTRVVAADDTMLLFLHGHLLARLNKDGYTLDITNAGYPTAVTKSRLNALPGVSVTQRDHLWYLNGQPWTGAWVRFRHNVSWFYLDDTKDD